MSELAEIKKPVLAIAGATGFVGRALASILAERFSLVGISRTMQTGTEGPISEWRCADLFDQSATVAALRGVDFAVYLVHSMMPSARLTQARFEDLDLLCADNFGRAAAAAGVRQMIYLGGLVPESAAKLSAHLASREEVERALTRYGVPVTVLRAGLVIGGGGSSFDMLLRLVRRLPILICPAWTANLMQPIAASDVVQLLAYSVGREECFGQVYDVATEERLSYRELMAVVASELGLRRRMVPVRFFSPGFSTLWVSLITQTPRELVGPLVQSLKHEMTARDHRLAKLAGLRLMSVREALRLALGESAPAPALSIRPPASALVVSIVPPRPARSLVRSVQRMQLPLGCDAAWASAEYMRWLPRALHGLFGVAVGSDGVCLFGVSFLRTPLLALAPRTGSNTADQAVFDVESGLLVAPMQRGRFELRQVLDERTLITAIHDFAPRLPWLLYRCTQAVFHGWVMAAFARHLRRSPATSAPASGHN